MGVAGNLYLVTSGGHFKIKTQKRYMFCPIYTMDIWDIYNKKGKLQRVIWGTILKWNITKYTVPKNSEEFSGLVVVDNFRKFPKKSQNPGCSGSLVKKWGPILNLVSFQVFRKWQRKIKIAQQYILRASAKSKNARIFVIA